MTSDTARRLAEEKYPHYVPPSWGGGATKEDVMPSVDASWQDAEADMQRAAFLAGWDAAIEHAARVVIDQSPEREPGDDDWAEGFEAAQECVVNAVRAERSDR